MEKNSPFFVGGSYFLPKKYVELLQAFQQKILAIKKAKLND